MPNGNRFVLLPLDVTARYEFPHPDGGILELIWYDGIARPKVVQTAVLREMPMGVIFEGEDGILEADYGGK